MKAPSRRSQGGFSLVEIVLALGVFSIAIVVLLGLFPTALNTAQSGRGDTIAAQIGRSIIADLRSHPFDQVRVQRGGGASTPDFSDPFSLATAGKVYLKFAYDGADATIRPIGMTNEAAFQGGAQAEAGQKALYYASIEVIPDARNTSLSQVVISVEYPGAAKQSLRTSARFVTNFCR